MTLAIRSFWQSGLLAIRSFGNQSFDGEQSKLPLDGAAWTLNSSGNILLHFEKSYKFILGKKTLSWKLKWLMVRYVFCNILSKCIESFKVYYKLNEYKYPWFHIHCTQKWRYIYNKWRYEWAIYKGIFAALPRLH